MRPTESDHDSLLSISPSTTPTREAGPRSISNGFTNKAAGSSLTNGASSFTNGALSNGESISRVSPPGRTLYEDSSIDREEFIRLVIQSLKDIGYNESAATLEAESGYAMESAEVSRFRHYVLDGSWQKAEITLKHLGLPSDDELWEAKFLISRQKYLELIESRKTTEALSVLRDELAPLNVVPDELLLLSSLLMCADPDDLRRDAEWDGASGTSRRQLLADLQRFVPSSIMVPQRRFLALLNQAQNYQRSRCVYHNSKFESSFTLFMDHQCGKSSFPRVTTAILDAHADEVWNMAWSHDGNYLATAGKDKTAIIWRIGLETEPSIRGYAPEVFLRDHPYSVGCLAWSTDDTVLLTSAESIIKLWNTKTGTCIRTLEAHTETVTSLAWLPDGTGFVSGGLDKRIILWDREGKQRDTWGATPLRVTDLAVAPDFTRLVTIGMYSAPGSTLADGNPGRSQDGLPNGASALTVSRSSENRMVIYDLVSKQVESSIRLEGELTSVKISQDSQYALINHAPDEVFLWDLNLGRLARKFTGQKQGRHVIRSCFGGVDGNFVISGSEDGNVYVWHKDTGALLEVLSGHGGGSVNSVAWNPRNERMFASCSDDNTIRIWEATPELNENGCQVDLRRTLDVEQREERSDGFGI